MGNKKEKKPSLPQQNTTKKAPESGSMKKEYDKSKSGNDIKNKENP